MRYARRGVLLILEKPMAASAANSPSSKMFITISLSIELQNVFNPSINIPAQSPAERHAVSIAASKNRLSAHK